MIHRIAVFVTALLLSFAVQASPPSNPQADSPASSIQAFTQELQLEGECPEVQEMNTDELILAQGCCKVCRKGKACGDSCISRNYTCHKGPGCACNG